MTIAAILLEPEQTDGTGVKSKTGFDGPVILDPKGEVAALFGAGIGSVVVVDPKRQVRFHKPGSKFKRPRPEIAQRILRALTALDKDPKLLEKARAESKSAQPDTRIRGVKALANLDAVGDLDALARILGGDPQPKVRAAAAEALASLRDPRAVPPLCQASKTGDAAVREAAASALAGFGDDFNDYPGPFFRLEYTHAVNVDLLANEASVKDAASSLCQDKNPKLRALGARIEWRLKEKADKAILLTMARDADEDVRYAALAGLAAGFRTDADVQSLAKAVKGGAPRIDRVLTYIVKGPEGKVRE